jgi:hypothetical protein
MKVHAYGAILVTLASLLLGCEDGQPLYRDFNDQAQPVTRDEQTPDHAAGKLDALLRAMVQRPVTPADAHRAVPGKLGHLRVQKVDGVDAVLVDVFIEVRPEDSPGSAASGPMCAPSRAAGS